MCGAQSPITSPRRKEQKEEWKERGRKSGWILNQDQLCIAIDELQYRDADRLSKDVCT